MLDIGCGAGLHLAAMLEAAPDATGIGVDVDPDAAALARRTLSERGLADVVVTTVAGPQLFSRHLDLLLRAQEGRMELPVVDVLLAQLREAGLQPKPPQRIGPAAAALSAVTAIR